MRTLLITPRAAILAAAASVALGAATAATAATPLTGEALSGTGATANAHGSCLPYVAGSGTFRVSGTAIGPYPGSFSETGGFSVSGQFRQPMAVSFSATFTIKSGATTITGGLRFPPYRDWLVGFSCTTSSALAYTLINLPVNYTAAISGQTYQGTARTSGAFDTVLAVQPVASVSDSFTG